MQIVQVTTGLDEKSGGPYFFAKELSKELQDNDFQMKSLVFGGTFPIGGADQDYTLNIRVNRNGFFSIPRIRHLMLLKGAELVIFHGFYLFSFLWILLFARNRIIVIPHGSISEYQHRHSNKRKSFFRILCRALDSKYRIHFYVASEQERQDTLKYFPNNVSTLLGLWVPTSNIPKNRVRASKQNNLCVISRIHPIKNIEIILDAFNHLRNVVNVDLRLFIAGEGQDLYVQSLHRKVSDLHLHPYVEFLGHLDEIEKNVLWEKSDLLCQMSFYENFGQVVAESVMHGVPVIVSKYLGISSIIESTQTGLVVDPNNFEEIAEAIMLGLKNHSQLRENCINRRLIFSKDYVAERWIRQIKLDCDL